VLKLAQKEKWQHCPKCRFMVERIEGCNYKVRSSLCPSVHESFLGPGFGPLDMLSTQGLRATVCRLVC
jgi:hypothetical protein